uniref:Uncharacterized protein n=1 Tax=Rhizophora mucronata TaxID=61149 RepID=A0A2P2QH33_RHIMU
MKQWENNSSPFNCVDAIFCIFCSHCLIDPT